MDFPMFSRKPADDTTQQILELLKQQQVTVSSTPSSVSLLSAKNINALVIAAVIGAFAFLWTNATEQPAKNAEQFSVIASQTAEIRTTVAALKNDFADFRTTLNDQQRQTAEVRSRVDTNAAEIEAMKKNIQTNADRIAQIEQDTR